MYMILAEATNEYKKEAGLSESVTALNKVLNRSGMDVPATIDTYQKMKEFIHNECAIEFYFEDHRFFDAKRWLEGPSLEGNIYNVSILKQADLTYKYTEYVQEKRIWNNFYYLHPFPDSEVNKQYGLIQNPGW
jgi:glycogen synthase